MAEAEFKTITEEEYQQAVDNPGKTHTFQCKRYGEPEEVCAGVKRAVAPCGICIKPVHDQFEVQSRLGYPFRSVGSVFYTQNCMLKVFDGNREDSQIVHNRGGVRLRLPKAMANVV